MNMTEIIKVQRPLSTNHPGNPWLLYDKNHTHVEHREEGAIDKKVRTDMGSDVKAYFEAEWSSEGWKIGKKVLAEDW